MPWSPVVCCRVFLPLLSRGALGSMHEGPVGMILDKMWLENARGLHSTVWEASVPVSALTAKPAARSGKL